MQVKSIFKEYLSLTFKKKIKESSVLQSLVRYEDVQRIVYIRR